MIISDGEGAALKHTVWLVAALVLVSVVIYAFHWQLEMREVRRAKSLKAYDSTFAVLATG
jgi:hypothetical protein